MKKLFDIAVMTSALLLLDVALAQEEGHLNVTTTVQKEEVTVNDSGERQVRLVEAETVIPGDNVIYTITFRNISAAPAENVIITNAVPENLTYVDGSAFGPGTVVEFSVDGGVSYGAADELNVQDEGSVRAATAEDYTHLRWVMQDELAAGSQGIARFRAILN